MNKDKTIPQNVMLSREVSLFKKNSQSDLFISKNEAGELVLSSGFMKILALTAQIKYQVIEYQKANNISAIDWLKTEWEGKTYHCPHPLYHLECLLRDREILDSCKMPIVEQYLDWVIQNEAIVTYTTDVAEDQTILTTPEKIRSMAARYDMANLIVWSDFDTVDGRIIKIPGRTLV